MNDKLSQNLMNFIENSPSCYHVTDNLKSLLTDNQFIELNENEKWILEKGKKYVVTRNGSSIIAFKVGKNIENYGFHIVASHSDSPTLKLKPNSEMKINNKHICLNVETYGGMIYSSWFDRPLSIAGRVMVKKAKRIETKLVHLHQHVMIPNLAIHMNREVNKGYEYNPQKDLLPIFGSIDSYDTLNALIAENINTDKTNILSSELFLVNDQKGTYWGKDNEYLACPKLDDLQCAYLSLLGFIDGKDENSINVYCCFDNEEVGSSTKQGADSTFLSDILKRIHKSVSNEMDYSCILANSYMVSADNAHAYHPNYPEKSDATNQVYVNEGIVIKTSARQSYTTDAISNALFTTICEKANVPFQYFANRSDILGGGTLGNISSSHVSIPTVDIGLAQFAMHSSYESGGVKDCEYLYEGLKAFYSTCIKKVDNDTWEVL